MRDLGMSTYLFRSMVLECRSAIRIFAILQRGDWLEPGMTIDHRALCDPSPRNDGERIRGVKHLFTCDTH